MKKSLQGKQQNWLFLDHEPPFNLSNWMLSLVFYTFNETKSMLKLIKLINNCENLIMVKKVATGKAKRKSGAAGRGAGSAGKNVKVQSAAQLGILA